MSIVDWTDTVQTTLQIQFMEVLKAMNFCVASTYRGDIDVVLPPALQKLR